MDGMSRIGSYPSPQGTGTEPQTQATTIDPFGAGKTATEQTQNAPVQGAEPGTQPHGGNEQPIAPTTSHELIRQDARYFIAPNT